MTATESLAQTAKVFADEAVRLAGIHGEDSAIVYRYRMATERYRRQYERLAQHLPVASSAEPVNIPPANTLTP